MSEYVKRPFDLLGLELMHQKKQPAYHFLSSVQLNQEVMMFFLFEARQSAVLSSYTSQRSSVVSTNVLASPLNSLSSFR